MKTNFETTADQRSLAEMINYAIMHTDQWVLNPLMWKNYKKYTLLMLQMRKYAYEFLEEEDPNEGVLKEIKDIYDNEL